LIVLDKIYTLKDFGLKGKIEHENSITPEFEHKTMKIPGRVGLWDCGTEINEKNFNLNLDVKDNDPIELQNKLDTFIEFLMYESGLPREFEISFDCAPDRHYKVKLREIVTPERMFSVNSFSLPLVAYDAYSFSNVYADEINWSSEELTFESNYSLGHEGSDGLTEITGPTTLNLFVDGYTVQPIINISGSASNLIITDGKYTISFDNFSNTEWVIDCKNYVAYKNGVDTLTGINLDEFILSKGNNQIEITGQNINLSIEFKFQDRY